MPQRSPGWTAHETEETMGTEPQEMETSSKRRTAPRVSPTGGPDGGGSSSSLRGGEEGAAGRTTRAACP